VREFLDLLAELDALSSLAALLDEGFTQAVVVEEDEENVGDTLRLEGEGVWHPFLPDATRNPVSLSGGGVAFRHP
jgi:hypothetical protein